MIKRFFIVIGGVLILIVGLIGLILPVLPGWPFIIAGLSIIAPAAVFRLKYKIDLKLFKRDMVYFSEWRKQKVDAGITTKFFPLFIKSADELTAAENKARLAVALSRSPVAAAKKISFSGRFIYLNQVHGSEVAVIEDESAFKDPGCYRIAGTDGAITNIPGLTLLALSADCLTVFFYAPGWVGVAHAGWRGTQKEITKKMLLLMTEKSGSPASEIRVIFGPCISGRRYEVGKEFTEFFSEPCLRKGKGKYYLDLVKTGKKALLEAGVRPGNISESGLCTVGHQKHFYSFRVQKESAGRMISFIQIHP